MWRRATSCPRAGGKTDAHVHGNPRRHRNCDCRVTHHGDTHSDRYAAPHPHACRRHRFVAHTSIFGSRYSLAYADSCSDTYPVSNADGNRYPFTHPDIHSNAHPVPYGHGYSHGYLNTHSDSHSVSHTDPHRRAGRRCSPVDDRPVVLQPTPRPP